MKFNFNCYENNCSSKKLIAFFWKTWFKKLCYNFLMDGLSTVSELIVFGEYSDQKPRSPSHGDGQAPPQQITVIWLQENSF